MGIINHVVCCIVVVKIAWEFYPYCNPLLVYILHSSTYIKRMVEGFIRFFWLRILTNTTKKIVGEKTKNGNNYS